MSDNQEDIRALRKRKLKLVFILGGPGSGKGTQCERLVSEYKFNHISTGDCIRDEIKRKTPLGLECEPYSSQGKLVPFELIVKILIKAILSKSGSNFLIDGFPRSLEQALFLDKYVKEIKTILNVYASDEVLIERLKGRAIKSGRKDDADEQIILGRIEVFKNESSPAIEFYKKFGIVKDINSEPEVNVVFQQVKEALLPEIYCIIGKRYSGKTTISKFLNNRMNLKSFSFVEFMNQPSMKKIKENDEQVITLLLQRLREEEETRVIIEDFPLKKEYYNLFVKNGKKIRKIFYLNCDDVNCTLRMKDIGKDDKNYIGCAQLNVENTAFEGKKQVLEYLKSKCDFVEINSNNTYELVCNDIVKAIQPEILILGSDNNEESVNLKNEFQNLITLDGYEIVDVEKIIEDTIKRGTKLGESIAKYEKQEIPSSLIVEMLKPVLFKEQTTKYLLVNYPRSIQNIIDFEREVCSIYKFIYFSKNYPSSFDSDLTNEPIQDYFKKSNRLHICEKESISNYEMNDIFGKNREFSIVFGLPLSGKKTVSKYLEDKHGYKVFDFITMTEALKVKLTTPEGNEEPVIDFPRFLNEFKEILSKTPGSLKFLITNTNLYIKDDRQLFSLLEITGVPRRVFDLNVDVDNCLIDRHLKKNEISKENFTEENKAELLASYEVSKSLRSVLMDTAIKVIPINNTFSESTTQSIVDKFLKINFIVVKHDYDVNISDYIFSLSSRLRILYIDLPNLIYSNFEKNTDMWNKLNSTFSQKSFKRTSYSTENERIFYEYNPLNFDLKLVHDLIKQYLNENGKEFENRANIVILSGYFNNDLLVDSSVPFNLPFNEIQNLLGLGNLLSYLQISRNLVEVEEKELPEKIIIPEKVVEVVKKTDLEDINNENNPNQEEKKEEEEVKQELNEDGTPKIIFKPELYEWTRTDGIPRNYIQHLARILRLPIEVSSLSTNELQNSLNDYIQNVVTKNIDILRHYLDTLINATNFLQKFDDPEFQLQGKISLFCLND